VTERIDDGLVSARPPERFTLVRSWTLHDVDHLSGVRRELLETVTASDAGPQDGLDDIPDRMILVASELATNALTHGLPPTEVRLLSDGREYLLDVADHDTGSTPALAGERAPGAGGFGLQIARRLSQAVGWYADESTKHVWAIFPAQR
jgi:serine/threonine-protein kinase RsbW